MSKWLVVMAAVLALGVAACGSDDDGKGSGLGSGAGCSNLTKAERDACTSAFVACGMTEDGPCKAEVDAYLECEEMDCFETRGPVYVACVESECPDAAPCLDCQ